MHIKTTMSKDEFFKLRCSLGLTRHEAAAVLNTRVDTLRKWEGDKSGGLGPHPTAIIYLQVIKLFPELLPPFWPERLIRENDNVD